MSIAKIKNQTGESAKPKVSRRKVSDLDKVIEAQSVLIASLEAKIDGLKNSNSNPIDWDKVRRVSKGALNVVSQVSVILLSLSVVVGTVNAIVNREGGANE